MADSALALSNMLVSTLVLSALFSLKLSDENRFISVLFHLKLIKDWHFVAVCFCANSSQLRFFFSFLLFGKS